MDRLLTCLNTGKYHFGYFQSFILPLFSIKLSQYMTQTDFMFELSFMLLLMFAIEVYFGFFIHKQRKVCHH